MASTPRYLGPTIRQDLTKKMVFLGGPRQVGKTTLARDLIGADRVTAYFTWDKIAQRNQALRGEWPADATLIVLDEFHKHRGWKSWIKGEYDTRPPSRQFLLTGSARLDLYRRGGDSLQGRYHYFRLHPFSVGEIAHRLPATEPYRALVFPDRTGPDPIPALLTYGGFPEPWLRQDTRHWRRWQQERIERLIQEDVRDLTMVQDLGNLALLTALLGERGGGLVSINALAEDLRVNHRTMANWLEILERLYFAFRLAPYQARTIDSVRKEKKLYLWDWSAVRSDGARLENLVASHLLKFCHWLVDSAGWAAELYYLRDSTGREADFLVCVDRKPWFAVEVKQRVDTLSPALCHFRDRLKIPWCYQVHQASREYCKDGIHTIPVGKFLAALV